MKTNTCCFIGHRKIEKTKEFENKLYQVVEDLIANKQVDTFLFGSKSEFNESCYKIVSKLKEKYLLIKRIYVRGEYQYISDDFKDKYFLQGFEDSLLPNCCKVGSKASYIERNKFMVDKSDYCVFYYNKDYKPEKKLISCKKIINSFTSKISGTKIAYEYAKKKIMACNLINIFKSN